MTDDTISRTAAISRVKKLCKGCYLSEHCGKCLTKCLVRKSINQLKKVPPSQPGWIPVTERLPEMTDTYLVRVGINENGEGMHTEVRTADWNVVWHEWYVHTTRCLVGDIIKWMPIPWEGEQDEQN